MCYSAQMYFFNTQAIQGFFEFFNYPSYLVIPLAIAKLLAVAMLLWRKSQWLTEWAYAGLFFDLVLAFFAHHLEDQSVTLTLLGMVSLLVSYFFGKLVRPFKHG